MLLLLVPLAFAFVRGCRFCIARCRQVSERGGVGQPLDRLDEVAAAEKYLQVDRTVTADATYAAEKRLLLDVDGEAVTTGAADRARASIFTCVRIFAEPRAMLMRDRHHVAGACLLDQRIQFVAAHALPP